jgi:ATP phosphoribosyltransferase
MLRVAVPNKGSLSESSADVLAEAGYRRRTDSRDLTVLDPANQVEFFFLRPKDIAIYVASGELDLGITGRDLALDSGATVQERVALGFGRSSFRYAAPAGKEWTPSDLAGLRIATSYPRLVETDLTARGIEATVIRLDGAVEISIQLGVADAIADVVGSGRTLRQHDLVAFGDVLCESEAVLIEREGAPAGDAARDQLAARVQGVVFAQQYMMLDYDCPRELLTKALEVTPGLESPTLSPMADENWMAVRAMVSRKSVLARTRARTGRYGRGRTSRIWADRPTGPSSSCSTAEHSPTPSGPTVVFASMPVHSPTGSRCRCTLRSVLRKVHSRTSNGEAMPFAESTTANMDSSAVGVSPATTCSIGRPHAAPGPDSSRKPDSHDHSMEST